MYLSGPVSWGDFRETAKQESVLRSVLIKRVNFKENVWGGTKKTDRNNEISVKRGFFVLQTKPLLVEKIICAYTQTMFYHKFAESSEGKLL